MLEWFRHVVVCLRLKHSQAEEGRNPVLKLAASQRLARATLSCGLMSLRRTRVVGNWRDKPAPLADGFTTSLRNKANFSRPLWRAQRGGPPQPQAPGRYSLRGRVQRQDFLRGRADKELVSMCKWAELPDLFGKALRL